MKVSEDRMNVLLDSVPVGIVALDGRGRVELQNAEASRILGLSLEATRGRSLDALLGDAHPAVTLVAEVMKSGREVAQHSCTLPERIEGRLLRVDLTVSPVMSQDGEGTVLTLRDRSIEAQLEALVAQRASAELFQHLAAGIAHEIRNPLSGISGAAELLEGRLGEGSPLTRYPQLIRSEIDRIRRLLDDLAQLTRGRELAVDSVNLHRVLDRILELQESTPAFAKIQIVREYDPSIPEMRLDRDRVTQIFLNLVRNAAQAMPQGGRLTVRTRVEALFHLSLPDGTRQRLVRTDIEDTGPGIPERDLPHIFTPFFTTKSDGTGLGLAVVQHWVVRHGGRISATPAHAGGTCMRVQLPVGRSA